MNYNIGGSTTLIEIKLCNWGCEKAVITKTLKKPKNTNVLLVHLSALRRPPLLLRCLYTSTQYSNSAKLFAPWYIRRKTLTYTLKSSTAFTALIFVKLTDVQHDIMWCVHQISQNFIKKQGKYSRNSLMPLSKVQLSLCGFVWYWNCLDGLL